VSTNSDSSRPVVCCEAPIKRKVAALWKCLDESRTIRGIASTSRMLTAVFRPLSKSMKVSPARISALEPESYPVLVKFARYAVGLKNGRRISQRIGIDLGQPTMGTWSGSLPLMRVYQVSRPPLSPFFGRDRQVQAKSCHPGVLRGVPVGKGKVDRYCRNTMATGRRAEEIDSCPILRAR
jgi:hypothetical protein